MTSITDALFNPRGIALVGASADPSKNTGRPQRFLDAHGYAGAVYPINPRHSQIQGRRAYKSIADIDGPCDHALIMVPTQHVPDAVGECGTKGISVATIYSDGFAESGIKGQARQRQLLDVAIASGVRVLGPNSMGVISPVSGLALSVNATLEMPKLKPGRLGLISQSGTILGALLSRGDARGIGFSRLLSLGNEADIGVGTLIDILVDDPHTDAILLFLETLRDAPEIAVAARRAFDVGKPVIAFKPGRSQAGSAVALSHSGALAGEDKAVDAFFRSCGIVRVETFETLFEIPPLLIGQTPPAGNRVGVMTTTGGGASIVVDRLGVAGLNIIAAPESLHQKLAEYGLTVGKGPLIDLTMAGTGKGVYGSVLQELLNSDECDAVVCVVGSSAQFHPELAVAPIIETAKQVGKPVAAFMVPQADQSLKRLADAGIAAFRTPEACADAMQAFFTWKAPSIQADKGAVKLNQRLHGTLDEAQSLDLFSQIGIPVARHWILLTDDAVPEDIAYPVAVKALSRKLPHKTEAGAVMLDIADADQLSAAMSAITENVARFKPDIPVDRFLVEEMVTGVGQVLIGYRHDPQVGPVVVLATGGILAEIYDDPAFRAAPVGHTEAEQMIAEVKGLAALRGYRNLPKGDMDALAHVLVVLSQLANTASSLVEAEINPLIVKSKGEGVVAVDGLVVFD